MAKQWRYGDAGDRYPVKLGDVWRVGPHTLVCNDLELSTEPFGPDHRPEMSFRTRLSILLQPSILCLCCYRIAHYLWVRRWYALARAIAGLTLLVFKANIPAESCVGPGCFLGHTAGTCFMGAAGRELTLYALAICCPREDAMGDPLRHGPRLGDRVTVGAVATVIGPITVGDDVTIVTATALDTDCPGDSLAFSTRLRPTARTRRSDG